MSTRRALSGLLRRDLLLAFRRRGDALTPLMFFAMVTLMFPLGLAPEQSVLRMVAPGLLWVAALLASLIGLSSLFGPDYEDGYLEQLVLSREPLSLMVLTRVFAHWLITGLPLLLIAPLLMVFLGGTANGMLIILLILGTPVLSLLGAIGAALTVGLRSSGMLLPVLILPLAVPVLIFGAKGTAMAMQGDTPTGPLYMLGFLLMLGLSLGPMAIASALRISLE